MTEEQQRIAIAKSVGIFLHDGDHAPSNYMFVSDLPDYLNDLNAIHTVERALNISDEQITYWKNSLEFVCNRDNTITLMATAAQRAEAYLKTIGKWVD